MALFTRHRTGRARGLWRSRKFASKSKFYVFFEDRVRLSRVLYGLVYVFWCFLAGFCSFYGRWEKEWWRSVREIEIEKMLNEFDVSFRLALFSSHFFPFLCPLCISRRFCTLHNRVEKDKTKRRIRKR